MLTLNFYNLGSKNLRKTNKQISELNIGKKFADLQKDMYGVNAQPFYVLLSPDGITIG